MHLSHIKHASINVVEVRRNFTPTHVLTDICASFRQLSSIKKFDSKASIREQSGPLREDLSK